MIGFIQYYNRKNEKIEMKWKFLCLKNVVANSNKADSDTIIQMSA